MPDTGTHVFPSTSDLPHAVSWPSCLVLAVASSLLITVSLGPMAAALGNLSPLVWTGTAIVGAAQCLLLAELCSRFPTRAGGTAQYAHRIRRNGSPTIGAISSWSYWMAWTPGIAVSLLLAAEYLTDAIGLDANPVPIAAVLGVVLYATSALGLRVAIFAGMLAGAIALVPLIVILLTPVLVPGSFKPAAVVPFSLPDESLGPVGVMALIAKWAFVAAWASYGAEMASTLVAEVRDAPRVMPRVMAVSAWLTLAAFAAVPVVMIGLVGAGGLAGDPATPFLGPAEILFGDAGRTIVGLMLAGALILSSQAFIIASSRTIYQIARDGHLPRFFGRVSRRGVPIGSMAWDALVIGVMLAIFGPNVVDIVAAANVGYLIVFVLLPIAYLRLRTYETENTGAWRARRWSRPLAVTLVAFNSLLLVWGGAQWGPRVLLTGTALCLLIVPVAALTRRRATRSVVSLPPVEHARSDSVA